MSRNNNTSKKGMWAFIILLLVVLIGFAIGYPGTAGALAIILAITVLNAWVGGCFIIAIIIGAIVSPHGCNDRRSPPPATSSYSP